MEIQKEPAKAGYQIKKTDSEYSDDKVFKHLDTAMNNNFQFMFDPHEQ